MPPPPDARAAEHVDVIIVGAGLSGIGAACHLQKHCPGRRYVILESRGAIGGTWDLFRYPGIRSDSDMYTLGYAFKPWAKPKAIADGPSILQYVRETATENGVEPHIRFHHEVKSAAWSSEQACWTVQVERTDTHETVRLTCSFLLMCSGYYSYESGYTPEFAGRERFGGQVVHPQHWTPDIGYTGQRVVVIGSGATAVTLAPELTKQAAHVTLLQRSPTYMISRPSEDPIANWLREHLPARMAYAMARWMRVLLGMYFFRVSRRRPEQAKQYLLGGVRAALGPDYDVATHFTPRYKPWDQRICLVPDGDLFGAVKTGRLEMVTDQIDTFTEKGLRLQSGRELEADLIVTATGLNLRVLGGMRLSVDGRDVDLATTLNYKGCMFSGVPNLASAFGYTNASWTLKCDLICEYVCRILNLMEKRGYRQCTPRNGDDTLGTEPWVDFSSGYFQRAMHLFPKQGSRPPWKLYQNYPKDIWLLRHGKVDDGVLEFAGA